MEIACIIVTYNGEKWIRKCLKSLLQIDVSLIPIVVDNNSSDQTVRIIEDEFPEVILFSEKENLGFGKANNLGIKKGLELGADFLFLLNQDAYWFEGSLAKKLIPFAKNEEAGILSPIHLAGNEIDLDFAFAKYLLPGSTPRLLGSALLKKNRHTFFKTDFVNAAAWIVKKEVFINHGAFNPVFDHYGEDNEFVLRIKKHGYSVLISKEIFIVHDRPQRRSGKGFSDYQEKKLRKYILDYFLNGEASVEKNKNSFYWGSIKELVKGNISRSFKEFNNLVQYKQKIHELRSQKRLETFKIEEKGKKK